MPGLRLAPLEGLDSALLNALRSGIYSVTNVQDVLLSREQLLFNLGQVAPNYEGFVGSTVNGVLVYSNSLPGILTVLDQANPPGRIGYYHWIWAQQP